MLAQPDEKRLHHLTQLLRTSPTAQMLNVVLDTPAPALASVEGIGTFDHCGVVLFAPPDDVAESLSDIGFQVTNQMPSTIVKVRLCARHGLDPAALDVRIVRARIDVPPFGTREIEVFAVTPAARHTLPEAIRAEEWEHDNETHASLLIHHGNGTELGKLRQALLDTGAAVPDGGGHNPHQWAADGGCSVLYFRRRTGRRAGPTPRRLELSCVGHHADVIAEHLAVSLNYPAAPAVVSSHANSNATSRHFS